MATTAVEPEFIDTNILVYAAIIGSPFHAQAMRALEEREQAGVELWVSRQILREYLSVLSRSGGAAPPLPVPDLVADVVTFEARYRIAEDGPLVTDRLLTLLGSVSVGGKQIHDANIAATMLVHGVKRLLTHNVADFRRFAPWINVIPLVPTP